MNAYSSTGLLTRKVFPVRKSGFSTIANIRDEYEEYGNSFTMVSINWVGFETVSLSAFAYKSGF